MNFYQPEQIQINYENSPKDGRIITNPYINSPRYISLCQEDSNALTTLERIANLMEDPVLAFLYVNHKMKCDAVSHRAINMVKYGYDSVWWQYEPDTTIQPAPRKRS